MSQPVLDSNATLAAEWYTDSDRLEVERREIFSHSWQYLGPAERLSKPGDYATGLCGDVPIVAVCDEHNERRAFVNVCRHRCAEVVSGHGSAKALRCPYHGWVYGLDGRLRGAPRSQLEPGFEAESLGLVPASVATWGPFLFVHPDADAPAFDDEYPGLSDFVPRGLDLRALRFHSHAEWQVEANWKVLSENYLECYHCSIAHPAFSRLLEVGIEDYVNRAEGKLFVSRTPMRSAAPGKKLTGVPYDPSGGVESGAFFLLWPNTTINVMPGLPHIYILGFTPLDTTHSIGYKDYYTAPGIDPERFGEMKTYFDHLGQEDRLLVESVQRGLRSGRVRYGRLMSSSEGMIQHFQNLVRQSLA